MQSLLSFSPEQLEFIIGNTKMSALTVKNNTDKCFALRVSSQMPMNFIIKQPYHILLPKKEKCISISLENAAELDISKQHKIYAEFASIMKPIMEEKEIKDALLKSSFKEKRSINIIIRKATSASILNKENSETMLSKFKIKSVQRGFAEKPKIEERCIEIDLQSLDKDKKSYTQICDKTEQLYKQTLNENSKLNEIISALENKNKTLQDNEIQMQQKLKILESLEIQIGELRDSIDKYKIDAKNNEQKITDLENADNKSKLELSQLKIGQAKVNKKLSISHLPIVDNHNEDYQYRKNISTLCPGKMLAIICHQQISINNYNTLHIANSLLIPKLILSSKISQCLAMEKPTYEIKQAEILRIEHISSLNKVNADKKYNDKVATLSDELSICKEQVRSLIERNLEGQKQIDSLKESKKSSNSLIETLQASLKARETESYKLAQANASLCEQINNAAKHANEIKSATIKSTEDNIKHLISSITEVHNKSVSQLSNIERTIVSFDCSHRIKPLFEYTTEVIALLEKTTELWNKNIIKIQNKNVKIAELYEQAFKLESGDNTEIKASIQYLKQNIRYVKNAKCNINETNSEDILNYLKDKKTHLSEISKEAAEIEKLIKGISNAKSRFKGINELAKQNLHKFSAIVYSN